VILRRAVLRGLLHRPLLLVFAIVGVALGVGVVVAIDLANASAERAFRLSAQALSGESTHRIVGGPEGLDESLYIRLRLQERIRPSAPVIEGVASVPQRPGVTLRIVGVDPFAEEPFRTYVPTAGGGGSIAELITEPGAALVLEETAARLGVRIGEAVELEVGGRRRAVRIVGTLQAGDEISARALENMVIVDLASAQELFGMAGRLSRIDLIVPDGWEGEALLKRIAEILPPEAAVTLADPRGDVLARMTQAFQLNLTALSLLALVVGMFLIYNTLSFSVLQRRELLGSLRTLGVTRREIFVLVLGEALLIGAAGTALGLLIGIALGSGLLHFVSRTIHDLYFVLTVRTFAVDPWSLVKGIALGLGASVAAAFVPAREAAMAVPRTVLTRSAVEGRRRALLPLTAGAGAVLLLLGGLLLLISGRSIPLSFGALFAQIAGYALIVPGAAVLLLRLVQPVTGALFGLLGRMAPRSIVASLSRTGVATAALVVAVSATIGVGIMIGSFRETLVSWLESYLRADLYVAVAGDSRERPPLDPLVIERLSALAGVELVTRARHVTLETDEGPTDLFVADMPAEGFAGYTFTQGDPETVRRRIVETPAVIVSEPFAWHRRLATGDAVRLRTDLGERDFTIAGIFTDFSTDRGRVVMSRTVYERYWRDRQVDALGIYLDPGRNADAAAEEARRLTAGVQQVEVYSNRGLREASMATFDRTFAITAVLRMLAIIIAFVGILNALLAMQVERGRELAVLRANGLTPRQLWALVMGETGLIGLLSGLLAVPLGLLQALVLIHVINRRSFGWTLQTAIDPLLLLQAVGLAILAALLAGIYPAWRMARTSPAMALREE
jgi:putative ABC transport system permease protein